jgi:hypothetical protein
MTSVLGYTQTTKAILLCDMSNISPGARNVLPTAYNVTPTARNATPTTCNMVPTTRNAIPTACRDLLSDNFAQISKKNPPFSRKGKLQ